MQTRRPLVAGQFYPAQHDSCIDEINEYLAELPLPEALPDEIVAGIVPHAGWTFSGSLAAAVFAAVKQQHEKVHTFVIFGAAHGYYGPAPAVYEAGFWNTPLGDVAIDEELAEAIIENTPAVADSSAHRAEHSIEVQVPFIQYLFGGAKIVPVIVPPSDHACRLGRAVGRLVAAKQQKKVVCIASTDLTHYGPRYGFVPMGTGPKAIEWATSVNDRRFIDLALKLEPEALLQNALANQNACGPGAAAAAVAAARELGKTEGVLLAHTNSNEVMKQRFGQTSPESVGYAAIVY